MKKVIRCTLDPHSIANAINELNAYKTELETKVKLLVTTLTERGANIVRAKIVSMDAVDTGELLNSVDSCLVGNIGFIRVNAEYGMFVEFGTGIVGSGAAHPAAGVYEWQYDVHQHGTAGWVYPKDDGTFGRTSGQPSRPFMYETALQLRDMFPTVAREVFG